jgi:Domain of unknown function (DUF4217)
LAPNPNKSHTLANLQTLRNPTRKTLKNPKPWTAHRYKEHHCRFIFRLADLDLGALGMTFGLLRMPKMPEIKGAASLRNFTPSDVDPDSVKVLGSAPPWFPGSGDDSMCFLRLATGRGTATKPWQLWLQQLSQGLGRPVVWWCLQKEPRIGSRVTCERG